MKDFDKHVICDIVKDEVIEWLRENYTEDKFDIEEYAYEKVMKYFAENIESKHKKHFDDINEITKLIMSSIDFNEIEEEIIQADDDEEYINKHGMYGYLGLDRRDF